MTTRTCRTPWPVKMERQFSQTYGLGASSSIRICRKKFPYVNGPPQKRASQQLVYYALFALRARRDTVVLLDALEGTGLHLRHQVRHSLGHRRRCSFRATSTSSWKTPKREVVKVQQQYPRRAHHQREGYTRSSPSVGDITERVATKCSRPRESGHKRATLTPVFVMADSGARVRNSRSAQLSPHARFDGQAFRRSHRNAHHFQLREGLTVLQYFIFDATGARKGLAVTALKTPIPATSPAASSTSRRT